MKEVDALDMGKGYLNLDTYPLLKTWTWEIDADTSPTFFANDFEGPIAFQGKKARSHNSGRDRDRHVNFYLTIIHYCTRLYHAILY